MNMYGIMRPAGAEELRTATRLERLRAWVWQRRMFLGIVVAPMILLSIYLFAIASDQYESEAHFLVRSQNISGGSTSGASQALSAITGVSTSMTEAMSVSDYLTSHDAVDALRRSDHLVERFNREDADFLSRLRQPNPTPERLLKYYKRQVNVSFNLETGITTLTVHSFRPEDSYELVRKLLELGEQRVNLLNLRSYNDAVATARRQLDEAEQALASEQSALTRFRQQRKDINPQVSGQVQIGLVATLNAQLAAARAQMVAMGNMVDHNSPQYLALASRVQALQGQVAGQQAKLTGGSTTIAANMGGYEGLALHQQFLAKRYDAAASALQRARDQAVRQQLYLVRIVEPNMPVKALYPERWRIMGTVLIALLLAYSIGWLIIAGVKEHAA